jgi:hypothetical protein
MESTGKTAENFAGLSELSSEFGSDGLAHLLSEFRPSVVPTDAEARGRIATLDATVGWLWAVLNG